MTYRQTLLLAVVPVLALPLTLQGCTTESWYSAVNRSSDHHCRKLPPDESQKCLAERNRTSYTDYEKERAAQKQQ